MTPRVILDESFAQETYDSRLSWFHKPARVVSGADRPGLVVETDSPTDFWQRTHYGFRADTGHVLGIQLDGNFSVMVRVRFFPVHQYDQAGVMIRINEDCWVKASVEFEPDGPAKLGSVVTNRGYSDWSLQDFPFEDNAVSLRILKRGHDIEVEFRGRDSGPWSVMRVAHLDHSNQESMLTGLYACSPKGAGFRAEFSRLQIVMMDDESPVNGNG